MFFAEGATLAHVARPYLLATMLNPQEFDVEFARPVLYAWLTSNARFVIHDLPCQEADVFAARLRRGQPLYDFGTLRQYVDYDLRLIDAVKPDIVVGDFRLSLAVSARLQSIPYATVCDAYWSPQYSAAAPLPVLWFTRFAPIRLAEFLFSSFSGIAFHIHADPVEKLRLHFGLASGSHDLRHCYTDADLRLFPNFQALFPSIRESPTDTFIGPVSWSPDVVLPSDFRLEGRPFAYVTMGSSGDTKVICAVTTILDELGFDAVIATAGRSVPGAVAHRAVRLYDFLPGNLVCHDAAIVICNGGSPTTNQALSNGRPVLGIATNMDQLLNMHTIADYGAGILLRSDRATPSNLRAAIQRLVENPEYPERACALARDSASINPGMNFTNALLSFVSAKDRRLNPTREQ